MKRGNPGWWWIVEGKLSIKLRCNSWQVKYKNGPITRWWQLGKVRLVYLKI